MPEILIGEDKGLHFLSVRDGGKFITIFSSFPFEVSELLWKSREQIKAACSTIAHEFGDKEAFCLYGNLDDMTTWRVVTVAANPFGVLDYSEDSFGLGYSWKPNTYHVLTPPI